MDLPINFSGLGFEVGQGQQGLAFSSEYVRKYFDYLSDQGLRVVDHGDVPIQNLTAQIKIFSEDDLNKIEWDRYQFGYNKTCSLLNQSAPLLNWGGDHSVAISTVGAFANMFPNGYVLWIDAHADLNLPSKSMTGNFHGMPLSVLLDLDKIASNYFKWLKRTLNPQKLIYLGLRDVDSFELSVIDSLKIRSFFYKDIKEYGITCIANQIRSITAGNPLHVSFDIDGMDPLWAPSTGVPVANGLLPSDMAVLGDQLFRHSQIKSVDVVEVNPGLGTPEQVESTYRVAFNFLSAVFNHKHEGRFYVDLGKGIQRKHSSKMESCL